MHNSFYKGKKPFTKKEKEAAADREALTAYREQKKEYKSYTTPLPKPKSYQQQNQYGGNKPKQSKNYYEKSQVSMMKNNYEKPSSSQGYQDNKESPSEKPYIKKGIASLDNYANRLNPNNVHFAGVKPIKHAKKQKQNQHQLGYQKSFYQKDYQPLKYRSYSSGDNHKSSQDISRQQFQRQPSNSPPRNPIHQNQRQGRNDIEYPTNNVHKDQNYNDYGSRGVQQAQKDFYAPQNRDDGIINNKSIPAPGEHQIYVHNVDFEVTANQVVDKFRSCGEIIRWHFPRKEHGNVNQGRHRGYGFVYFKTALGKFNALKLKNNPPMVGRRVVAIGLNQNDQHKIENDHYQRRDSIQQETNQIGTMIKQVQQPLDAETFFQTNIRPPQPNLINTEKIQSEDKMDPRTLDVIKSNQKSNQKPDIDTFFENKDLVGKNLRNEFSNLEKNNNVDKSQGINQIAKPENNSQGETGQNQSSNLRGLIGSIMDMKDEQGDPQTSNLNKDTTDQNLNNDQKQTGELQKNQSVIAQTEQKELNEAPLLQRTETNEIDEDDDMKIFRDAFAIALMDEAQIEPDEVVKQDNDQQNDKKSNQQENVKGSDIKNEMPPPTLISADQGTKKIHKEDKGTKKNDQLSLMEFFGDHPKNIEQEKSKIQPNQNSNQQHNIKQVQNPIKPSIQRKTSYDGSNRNQPGPDKRPSNQNMRDQNQMGRNNLGNFNRAQSNEDRRHADRDHNDAKYRDNFKRNNYSKDDYNRNNLGPNRGAFNQSKNYDAFDRGNNDDKFKQLGKRNHGNYNNEQRSNDEFMRKRDQPRNQTLRYEDKYQNKNQLQEHYQSNRNQNKHPYLNERDRQNQDKNDKDRRDMNKRGIRSRSPNDFDKFGASHQYKRQKHDFQINGPPLSQDKHQNQSRHLTQQEFMNDGKHFREGPDQFQQNMQRFQRQSQMSDEAMAQQMFFSSQGMPFQNQPRFPRPQFAMQQGPDQFDPMAFQAFFEKDPFKQGKMDSKEAVRQAQYAAKMAQLSRMMNPQRFQTEQFFQPGPSAMMQAPYGHVQQMAHPMVNNIYRNEQKNYGDMGFKSKNNLEEGDNDDGIDNFDFDNEQSFSFHDTLAKENFKSPQTTEQKPIAQPTPQNKKKPGPKPKQIVNRQTKGGKQNN